MQNSGTAFRAPQVDQLNDVLAACPTPPSGTISCNGDAELVVAAGCGDVAIALNAAIKEYRGPVTLRLCGTGV